MGIIKNLIKSPDGRWKTKLDLYPTKQHNLFDYKKLWIYVCMNIRAIELAKSKFVYTKNGEELSLNHWAYTIMEDPNPNYSFWDMIYNTSMWLDLTGNSYWLPYTAKLGRDTIINKYVMLPSNRVKPHGKDVIDYYEIRMFNKTLKIPAEEIIHFKDMSPSENLKENFYIGNPAGLNAIKDVHEVTLKKLDYIENYFTSDGVSPFVMTTDSEDFAQEDAENMLHMYNENIGNPRYRAQSILPFGMKIENLGSADLGSAVANSQKSEDERVAIASAFGVPDSYVTSKYSGRAVAYDTIQVMNENSTYPRAEKIVATLNQYYSKVTDIRIKHIPKPFKNDEFELKKTSTMYMNGAIDVNEYREANGYEPSVELTQMRPQ